MKSLKRVLRPRAKTRAKTPSSPLHLVVGLRNPGADYEGSRHNVGFEVIVRVLDHAQESLGRGPLRVSGMTARAATGCQSTLFLVPNTFMNESGRAVRAMLDYYKIDPSNMLVVHDDIDLPFGRLRVQVDGGSGGHNGVRAVESALGGKGFSRLKVGVGRPPESMEPADYVLRPFTRKERPEADLMVEDAAEVVERWAVDRAAAQELAAHRGRDV